jgi:ABC-type transport system involved in cytochrome bd biosynthesis fused ATPase/permease subunit
MCKDRTIVLATHAIDYVSLADKIVILDEGNILVQGSYESLKNHPKMKEIISEHEDQR